MAAYEDDPTLGDDENVELDVLIGAEGPVMLRYTSTGGVGALADQDAWRFAYALLQGGELFVKELPMPWRPAMAPVVAPSQPPPPVPTAPTAAVTGVPSWPATPLHRVRSVELPKRGADASDAASAADETAPLRMPLKDLPMRSRSIVGRLQDSMVRDKAGLAELRLRVDRGEGGKPRANSIDVRAASTMAMPARGSIVGTSWLLEGAAVDWLDAAADAGVDGAEPLLEPFPPNTVIHCASLAWGDLVLTPQNAMDAEAWLVQLRAAAGLDDWSENGDGEEEEEEEPPEESEDENDLHAYAGTNGAAPTVESDAWAGATSTAAKSRLEVEAPAQPAPAAPVAQPQSPASDAISSMGVLSPRSLASPPADVSKRLSGTPKSRPASLAIGTASPPAAPGTGIRRQSRFGLGAVPVTPIDGRGSNLVRYSHCIPHRFVTEAGFVRLAKCRLCHRTIFDLRAIKCMHCGNMYHKKCSEQEGPNCGMAHINKVLETALASSPSLTRQNSGATIATPQGTPQSRGPKVKAIGDDVFGVPLESLIGEDTAMPSIASMCMQAVEARGCKSLLVGLDTEGIYRLSGSKRDLERLRTHFAFGRPNILGEDEWPDIHVITGVFKAWLRELPDPLLTHDLFIELTDLVEDDGTVDPQRLSAVLHKLPRINYRVTRALIFHLRRVADHSANNRMPSDNLSAVFGPTLLAAPHDVAVAYIGRQCALVECMINHVTEIFGSDSVSS